MPKQIAMIIRFVVIFYLQHHRSSRWVGKWRVTATRLLWLQKPFFELFFSVTCREKALFHLYKIPNEGTNSCISGLCQRQSKMPQRWAMTICLLEGYIQGWGLSQEGARAPLPRLTSALFFSSASYSPANIFNYLSCTSKSGKGHHIPA